MSNGQKRILIVDDDASLGYILQQALKLSSQAYHVRLARNADEALAQISRRGFDLIITDIKMEGLSGLHLLKALRQVAPNTRTISMTAFSSDDIEKRARTLGVHNHLTKPFTIQEFREIVDIALEAEALSTPAELPPSQSEAVSRTLADLRANTGAHAVFLIQKDTANVLGMACDTSDLDLTSLAQTLVDITNRTVAEVARVFGGGSGFRRSQYVGETFNLVTYRLPGQGLLILVYSHHVKEGLIVFYARQAKEALVQILQAQTPSEPFEDIEAGDMASIDAPPAPPQAVVSEPTSESEGKETPSEPMSLEQALAMGLLDDSFLGTLDEET
jgi:two-component system response regulator (stage 0 sporulation protein F)